MLIYRLKITLIKKDELSKIKIWKPIGFPEKMSKKNPPIRAEIKPKFSSGSSNKFKKIVEIKIKFKAGK